MNKYLKLTGLSLMLAGALVLSGCGDDKKPEPAKPTAKATATTSTTQKTTTTTTTTTQKPATPAAKLASGPNWYYPGYIKTQEDTPKMTPEIQKIVDECYAVAKLHPSAKGKFLNDSKINKNDQRKVRDLHFHAKGANYDDKVKFKNSKGKDAYQQEFYHIYITVDKDTSAVKNWRFTKYVMNQEITDGKSITLKEVK